MRLADRVILVSGAAAGIGHACARRFVAEGARVALVDVDADALDRAAAPLGPAALALCTDVARRDQVDAAVDATVAHFGRIDVLVNNAAVTHAASFLDLQEADFDRVLAVNLKGYLSLGQACARRMVEQGDGGAIVNLSSINAVVAIADQVPYVVSKGAINQLTKVMALALAPHRIRVNGIGPGTIATELARRAVLASPDARRRVLARTPLGRLGEPDEIARIAAFLASDEASYLTGQTLYADGGRLALNYVVDPGP